MACPPEDCGGIGGYEELAAWVRSGYDDAHLPESFEDAEQGCGWLPLDWHSDHFDVDEANAALAVAFAEPVVVTGELADLFEQLERQGIRSLRAVLARPMSHGPAEVSDDEAARLTEAYRVLLEVVGDGVALTSAGYLAPKLVEQLAERTGIAGWWIGKANREDLTPPVAAVRDTAKAVGLVSVRKGRLTPTAAGRRCHRDPQEHCGSTSSNGFRWAARSPTARPVGWRSRWSAAAYRRRSGARRSATCSSRSGGGADLTSTRPLPPRARPSRSSTRWPAPHGRAGTVSQAAISASQLPLGPRSEGAEGHPSPSDPAVTGVGQSEL